MIIVDSIPHHVKDLHPIQDPNASVSSSKCTPESKRAVELDSNVPVYSTEVNNSEPDLSASNNPSDDSNREEVGAAQPQRTTRVKRLALTVNFVITRWEVVWWFSLTLNRKVCTASHIFRLEVIGNMICVLIQVSVLNHLWIWLSTLGLPSDKQ